MMIMMTLILIALVLVYGLGLFCALWDEYRTTTPTWMYRYLAWVFPFEGWEEDIEEK